MQLEAAAVAAAMIPLQASLPASALQYCSNTDSMLPNTSPAASRVKLSLQNNSARLVGLHITMRNRAEAE